MGRVRGMTVTCRKVALTHIVNDWQSTGADVLRLDGGQEPGDLGYPARITVGAGGPDPGIAPLEASTAARPFQDGSWLSGTRRGEISVVVPIRVEASTPEACDAAVATLHRFCAQRAGLGAEMSYTVDVSNPAGGAAIPVTLPVSVPHSNALRVELTDGSQRFLPCEMEVRGFDSAVASDVDASGAVVCRSVGSVWYSPGLDAASDVIEEEGFAYGSISLSPVWTGDVIPDPTFIFTRATTLPGWLIAAAGDRALTLFGGGGYTTIVVDVSTRRILAKAGTDPLELAYGQYKSGFWPVGAAGSVSLTVDGTTFGGTGAGVGGAVVGQRLHRGWR